MRHEHEWRVWQNSKIPEQKIRKRHCLNPRHLSNKAVAARGDSLYKAAFGPSLVKHPTKGGNLHVQIAVLDRRSRPHRCHDLGPTDQVARPLHQ